MQSFRNKGFENFVRQSSIDRLFDLTLLSNDTIVQDDCAYCLEPLMTGKVCRASCGHAFHYGCIRPMLFTYNHGAKVCPFCQHNLFNANYGIPCPRFIGDDRQLGPLATVQNFVELTTPFNGMLGESRERKMFPLVSESVSIPHFVLTIDNLGTLFTGRVPQHTASITGDLIVQLVPGLLSELRMFWLGKEKNLDNFHLSKLRCEQLLRKVAIDADYCEFNLRVAPLAALYNNYNSLVTDVLIQPELVDSCSHKFITFLKRLGRGLLDGSVQLIILLMYLLLAMVIGLAIGCVIIFAIKVLSWGWRFRQFAQQDLTHFLVTDREVSLLQYCAEFIVAGFEYVILVVWEIIEWLINY